MFMDFRRATFRKLDLSMRLFCKDKERHEKDFISSGSTLGMCSTQLLKAQTLQLYSGGTGMVSSVCPSSLP